MAADASSPGRQAESELARGAGFCDRGVAPGMQYGLRD